VRKWFKKFRKNDFHFGPMGRKRKEIPEQQIVQPNRLLAGKKTI
jgi:hypothetical protein